jgi:hypothetical protein
MQLDKIFLNLGLAKNIAELATLLVILLAVAAILWLTVGRFRLHNFLVNIYISFALVQVVPKNILSFAKEPSILAFIVVLILLTLADRYIFNIRQYGNGIAVWQFLVLSILEAALLLSISLSFLESKDILLYISKESLVYFTDPWWQVAWMVLPLFFLAFARKAR